MTRQTFLGLPVALTLPAALGAMPAPAGPKIAVFSKHLQWLDVAGAAAFAREAGFDAVDLTVRAGGHVSPPAVRQDLPRAAEVIRRAGLELAMVTTGIQRASEAETAAVLDACRESGVTFYRWGGWKYDRARTIESQIASFRDQAKALAAENQRRGLCGIYHTHSGRQDFGASIWDILACLDGLPPEHLALNFDIGHATIEGGLGGWINSAQRAGRHLQGIAVKDFRWERNAKGEWQPAWTPIGEGMVRLGEFFRLVGVREFRGPLQLHFEYAMGGAEHGHRTITWSREQVLAAMRRDLTAVRTALTAGPAA